MWSNPGYDPTPLSVGHERGDDRRLGRAERRPGEAAAVEGVPGAVPAGVDVQDRHLDRRARERLHPADADGRTRTCSTCRRPTTTCTTSATSSATGGPRPSRWPIAFRSSCNVPFGQVGLDLGAQKLSSQAERWGLCPTLPPAQTGCEEQLVPFVLPFENGRFPEASYFDRARAGAGATRAVGLDNDLWNPLHLALITAAIANGGTMHVPHLVTEVRDAKGGTVADVRGRGARPTDLDADLGRDADDDGRGRRERHRHRGADPRCRRSPARPARRRTARAAAERVVHGLRTGGPDRPAHDRRCGYRPGRWRPRERGDRRPEAAPIAESCDRARGCAGYEETDGRIDAR